MRLPRTLLPLSTVFALFVMFAVPVMGADFQKGLNADAQYNLGRKYDRGLGVIEDFKTAVKWFSRAAKQGHTGAQISLGWMYEMGRGVNQDYMTALKWYTRAAEQGDTGAQVRLGAMHNGEHGLPQNYTRTHMWFNIAASQGHKDAGIYRDGIAKKMTPSQIAEAQKLARECVKKKYKGC